MELKERFIQVLELKYGAKDESTAHFGSSSFGQIARHLCISSSQFSKLISGTATEGMYIRSIENVERLIELERVKKEKAAIEERLQSLEAQQSKKQQTRSSFSRMGIAIIGVLAVTSILLAVQVFSQKEKASAQHIHPLADYFDLEFNSDKAFVSPYLKESEVQQYCPGSAYEGVWSLDEPYKLPLPDKKPGLYYYGKSADVRMKVSKNDTIHGKGHVLLAYEYLTNEIWLDTTRRPLSPYYFDKSSKSYTKAFHQLDFEANPNFQKVATIHSFFINKIEIQEDSIERKGEPGGRYATDLNKELIAKYHIDVQNILENVLSDLTITDCEPSLNLHCDPNTLQEGQSTIDFNCLYTIRAENLGLGGGYPYKKGFRLEKQIYANNLVCNCKN